MRRLEPGAPESGGYGAPPRAGMVPFAPKDGTTTRIRLIADTLTCEAGASEDHVYPPALAPGGPFAAAHATEECTQLIGASMKY